MRAKNKNVVFSGSVASVTRKTTMPKPKKRPSLKVPAVVQDGPWQGATLYMTQCNTTLPMVIKGDAGRYVFQGERTEPIPDKPKARRIIPAGLYWQGEAA